MLLFLKLHALYSLASRLSPCSRAMRKQKQRSIQYGLRPVCCLCRLDQMLRPRSTLCHMQNMNDHVCLAYSSSTALLLLLPRQGSQRLGLPASGEPQVFFCRAFAGETRKEEAEVDVNVDVDVLSHGNALTAGAHPGNLESGPLKNYGYLVSIPPKELPPFALLCSAFLQQTARPSCCLTYHAP